MPPTCLARSTSRLPGRRAGFPILSEERSCEGRSLRERGANGVVPFILAASSAGLVLALVVDPDALVVQGDQLELLEGLQVRRLTAEVPIEPAVGELHCDQAVYRDDAGELDERGARR